MRTITAGLNGISKGAIKLDGIHVEGADPERAVVFQSPSLFPWLSVKENVAIGVDRVYPKASQAELQEGVEYYLERVGLADAIDKQASDMSNGMRQRVYGADIVWMAVGIRLEVRVATDAHLDIGRGITVNDQMQTSDPAIYAVGECVEHNKKLFGLVAPLYDQANVVTASLLGRVDAFRPVQTATKLKVTGCDLFSAGDFAEGEGREDIVFRDPSRMIDKQLVISENRQTGAVLYGDTADGNWFFGPIKDAADITEMRDTFIFGPAFQGGAKLDPMAAVAALPPEEKICGCNRVCKGKIVEAVLGGANSLDLVRAQIKASSSCGTCMGLVERVMAATLGDTLV